MVAQGFYEWLDKGKEKQPYFVKRNDGKLMALGESRVGGFACSSTTTDLAAVASHFPGCAPSQPVSGITASELHCVSPEFLTRISAHLVSPAPQFQGSVHRSSCADLYST